MDELDEAIRVMIENLQRQGIMGTDGESENCGNTGKTGNAGDTEGGGNTGSTGKPPEKAPQDKAQKMHRNTRQ